MSALRILSQTALVLDVYNKIIVEHIWAGNMHRRLAVPLMMNDIEQFH